MFRVNSLWLSEAVWHRRTWWTLVQDFRYWLVAWRHQAILWTNVDWSSVRSCGIENVYPWYEFENNSFYSHISQGQCPGDNELTHWGRVMHICVSKLTIIGSDNGLSPGRRQAIIWTSAWILLIGPLGTNFSEVLIGNQTFSSEKMHLKMSSLKWCLFCLGLNELNNTLFPPIAGSCTSPSSREYSWWPGTSSSWLHH